MSDPTSAYGSGGYPPPPPQNPGGYPVAPPLQQAQELDASSFFGGLFDFGFTKFITLSFLKFVYVLVVVVMGVCLLGIIVIGFSAGPVPGVIAIIFGPIVVLLYLTWIRMGMEFLAVVFRMAGDIHVMRQQRQSL